MYSGDLGKLTSSTPDDDELEDAGASNVAPEYTSAENTSENMQETTHLSTERDDDELIYLCSPDNDYVERLVHYLTSIGVPYLKALYPYELDAKHKNYDKRKYFDFDQPLQTVPNTAVKLIHYCYCAKFGVSEKEYPLADHHARQIRARLKEFSIKNLVHAIEAAKDSDIYNGNLRFEGDSSWTGADLTWITKNNANVYKLAIEIYPRLD